MLRLLLIFMASMIAAASIFPRGTIQSDATCSGDFSWADNQQRMTPCLVAAYAQSACYSGTWTVPKLQNNSHYDFGPDACSCSWAVYNLLSACTACQNAPANSILTWASVSLSKNCSSLVSQTTYFPPNVPIPANILIPAWAGVNPSHWQDGQFNVVQAKDYAEKNPQDLNPAQASKNSTPVGAIVGGVVGGVVVLCLGAVGFFCIILKRRRANQQPRQASRPPLHVRSFSDLSQKTMTSGYAVTFADAPMSPAFTHRALSFFGSARNSVFSTQTHSRVPSVPAAIPILPEHVIEPFVVPPQSPTPSSRPPLHRKESSDTSIQAVTRADEGSSRLEGGRRRLNPPAYTPSATGSPGPASQPTRPGHRPGRGKKGSQETLQSSVSHGGRNPSVAGGDSSVSPSSHNRQTSGSSNGLSGDVPIA